MTLTLEPDLDMFNMNQHAKYLRHRSFCLKVTVRTYRQTDRHYTPKECSTWPLMAGKRTDLLTRKMKDTNVCTRWCFLLREKLCSVRQDMVYTRQRRPSPDRSRLDMIYTHCRLDNSPLDTILNMPCITDTLRNWWSGSVAEWLACWTHVQKGPGSNRSRDAVG